VVGQPGGAETGEQAEGEVKETNESLGEQAKGAGWDAEVGEVPESSGGKVGGEMGDELVEFGLGEAVEEEVSDDEIVEAGGLEGEGVGFGGGEAGGGHGGSGAEEMKHGGAEVDGVGVQVRVAGEEMGEKAAVAIAEDKGSAGVEEPGEEVDSAVMEGGAEGEELKPAVGSSDAIEVRPGGGFHRARETALDVGAEG